MKIPDGPWKVYVAPKEPPECPTHKGPMKLNIDAVYECRGFDGEGCDYKIKLEDRMFEIGTTDPGDFKVYYG